MRRMFSLKQLQEIADNRVQTLVEGGTLENAKPIYYHPVAIYGVSEQDYAGLSLSLVILNNSATPFDSLSQLITWARTNGITYLCPASGSAYSGTKRMVVSWIDIAEEYITLRGHYVDDDNSEYLRSIYVADTNFSVISVADTGVNKIN